MEIFDEMGANIFHGLFFLFIRKAGERCGVYFCDGVTKEEKDMFYAAYSHVEKNDAEHIFDTLCEYL